MNSIVTDLCKRCNDNDPSLRHVSVRSLPLFSLSSLEVKAIVQSLRDNRTVESLELTLNDAESKHNDYTYLEDTLSSNVSLKKIRVSSENGTALACVFNGLASNSSVSSFQVGDVTMDQPRQINADSAMALYHMLKSNKTLDKLELWGFNFDEPGMRSLAVGLKGNTSLRTLELVQIESSPQVLQFLVSSLVGSTGIKTINLVECDLGGSDDVDCPPLTALLEANSTLEEFRLVESNFLTRKTIKSFTSGLESNKSLKLLDLRGNAIGADGAEAIACMLQRNTSLRKLILDGNDLGDEGCIRLAKGLRSNTTLEKLSLRDNSIGPRGAAALADALQAQSGLRCLDLSDSLLGDMGARAIGLMLTSNEILRELTLESCAIGPNGAIGLSEGLKVNSSLQKLSLSANILGEDGARGLMPGIMENKGLLYLGLAFCQLGDEGVAALASAMTKNTTLRELRLPFNLCGNKGATAFGEMLPLMAGLANLFLQFNTFDMEGLSSILKGLHGNTSLKDLALLNDRLCGSEFDAARHVMDRLLLLNRGGRRILKEEYAAPSLWPHVLAYANKTGEADPIYYLLQQRPEIVQ